MHLRRWWRDSNVAPGSAMARVWRRDGKGPRPSRWPIIGYRDRRSIQAAQPEIWLSLFDARANLPERLRCETRTTGMRMDASGRACTVHAHHGQYEWSY